ncbi:MAG TPA: fumarylacetoacetate hydrolase family protein [Puia sp.]|jgi:2-dehydro-3-deoxy-D-arabinonate dehydratase|nr:fumarylacetoacetate hydrolase family protein [Puia sp.]
MKIYRTEADVIVIANGNCYVLDGTDWDQLISRDRLHDYLQSVIAKLVPEGKEKILETFQIKAPIKGQEIWAAGVTYLKSKTARMEESEATGGAGFYDKVYAAERPELFFKANAYRTVGHLDLVNIRKDSTWDVPEPELTLLISPSGNITGYTIGNDMSSRSIEGENPLYLPQAKCYDRSAALGPCIYVPEQPIPQDTKISMRILRKSAVLFEGETLINQMKRSHTELAGFLFRECSFPSGVFLMTGTCIVPGNDVTLKSGDEIQISIDHIGELINFVA